MSGEYYFLGRGRTKGVEEEKKKKRERKGCLSVICWPIWQAPISPVASETEGNGTKRYDESKTDLKDAVSDPFTSLVDRGCDESLQTTLPIPNAFIVEQDLFSFLFLAFWNKRPDKERVRFVLDRIGPSHLRRGG